MTAPAGAFARFTYWAEPGGPHNQTAPTVVVDLEGAAPEEHILKLIRTHGRFYESDLLEHLARHGPRGGVHVDVGANIGNHSVFFGRFLADHVVAIEPNPELPPILERNLRANAVARWTTVAVAVGARPGTGRLRPREGYEGNAGAQRVCPSDGETDGVEVEVDTLDTVLAGLGPKCSGDVRLVKLDIEGMELEALQGAVSLLEREGPDVVVEAPASVRQAVIERLTRLAAMA